VTSKKKTAPKVIRWNIDELVLPEREKLKAVAIKYDVEKDRAPKVLAAGRGAVAERILKIAEDNHVPLCSDPALTDLLSKLEITQEVPPQLYTLVAEVLAFIYQLDKMARKRQMIRKKFAKK